MTTAESTPAEISADHVTDGQRWWAIASTLMPPELCGEFNIHEDDSHLAGCLIVAMVDGCCHLLAGTMAAELGLDDVSRARRVLANLNRSNLIPRLNQPIDRYDGENGVMTFILDAMVGAGAMKVVCDGQYALAED